MEAIRKIKEQNAPIVNVFRNATEGTIEANNIVIAEGLFASTMSLKKVTEQLQKALGDDYWIPKHSKTTIYDLNTNEQMLANLNDRIAALDCKALCEVTAHTFPDADALNNWDEFFYLDESLNLIEVAVMSFNSSVIV